MSSAQTAAEKAEIKAKPFLKWAGGKTQLLPALLELVPDDFNQYIEPFVGAGALFFALAGHRPALISDANEELVHTYIAVRDNVTSVIDRLKEMRNDKEFFYFVRSQDVSQLKPYERAARLIFLNKTCFNGLYRVNRHGRFNTPYNGNEGANFIQEDVLIAASNALKGVKIAFGDYRAILEENATNGDFVFLDPPYQPVGKYSDFKRYTKERFHEDDHRNLAAEFKRLVEIGCRVILTNSVHDSILELFADYETKIVDSKRLISSDSRTRIGQDLIVLGGFQ